MDLKNIIGAPLNVEDACENPDKYRGLPVFCHNDNKLYFLHSVTRIKRLCDVALGKRLPSAALSEAGRVVHYFVVHGAHERPISMLKHVGIGVATLLKEESNE
jgi:hypothetical protein